jgi:uncharacterized membrane protein
MRSLLIQLQLYTHLLHVVQVQTHKILFVLFYVALRGFTQRSLALLDALRPRDR